MSELHVVWIEVEGFRRLQARSFFDLRNPRGEVSDQAIIAGTNGSGKTTLLEALLFGLGREELIVRDLPKAKRSANERGRFPKGARVSICVQLDGRLLRSDRTNGRSIWYEVTEPLERVVPHPDLIAPAPPPARVEYFSSWRAPALVGPVWPTTAGRRLAPTEANRLQVLKQRLANWRMARSYKDEKILSPWLTTMNEIWGMLHSHDGTRLADQPVEPDTEDSEAGFDLFILEADGRRRCSVDQASAGELEVLSLAGMLVDFSGILIIDEPELHLHGQWQRQILPTLRKVAPRAQIIATSHASPPWDQALSYQRFFLAPDGDPRRSDLTPPPERG